MAKLTDYRLLSFDVYGTLIDWESGVLHRPEPLAQTPRLPNKRADPRHLSTGSKRRNSARRPICHTPSSRRKSMRGSPPRSVSEEEPTTEECAAFGRSVGRWPAFPDTVDALRRLGRHCKLAVLSNVDRESFEATDAGPLEGVRFDRIVTAQEIGSYKPDRRDFGVHA